MEMQIVPLAIRFEDRETARETRVCKREGMRTR